MIEWVENNGSFEAREDGEYVGLVSQCPPKTYNAGLWMASLHTSDGGLIVLGPYMIAETAKMAFEEGREKNLTFLEWNYELANENC